MSSTTYDLTGDGVTITLLSEFPSTDRPGLTVDLEGGSVSPWFHGHYEVAASELTTSSPTDSSAKVSVVLTRSVVTRQIDPVRRLGLDLFIAVPSEPPSQPLDSAGAAVLIDYSPWPPTFHEVALTGTVSFTAADAPTPTPAPAP